MSDEHRLAEPRPEFFGNVRRVGGEQPEERLYHLFRGRFRLCGGIDKHHHVANGGVHLVD